MKIKLADSYGFCYGVKRAIEIAEKHSGSKTYGPLIHNKDEINRLKENYNIGLAENLKEAEDTETIVIRTHGIPKDELKTLKQNNHKMINATCPYVTKPQQIVESMSKEDYSIIIFGDKNHPEIKGVYSYGDRENTFIVNTPQDIEFDKLKPKVAVVAQTTRKPEDFMEIVEVLIGRIKEVRVFNTICNATFENQDATSHLAKEADVMIVIGGKHSSNTKQLHNIAKEFCDDSYLIENENELNKSWFDNKKLCGISAGASTPDWIVQNVIKEIKNLI
ncbi:4-hydroxy-3-methylbut-2-enyl diphosphate reductase [hydrothermal vent metagenome]|uniref:4-hydroxy-3-methylbut-2-enyl diphosphate reductase n=1 Tax=hydrothermal vent metagenome TaxID=652676 RepID=A0A1W1EHJ9_9ZZZZ